MGGRALADDDLARILRALPLKFTMPEFRAQAVTLGLDAMTGKHGSRYAVLACVERGWATRTPERVHVHELGNPRHVYRRVGDAQLPVLVATPA